MIQSFHHFLIDHLSSEGNSFPHNPLIFQHPLAYYKAVREKENMTHVVDIIYPRKVPFFLFLRGSFFTTIQPLPNELPPQATFPDILRPSLTRQMTRKATCQTCKQFSTFSSCRSISSADLPPILAVNTEVYNEENLRYWMYTKWEVLGSNGRGERRGRGC